MTNHVNGYMAAFLFGASLVLLAVSLLIARGIDTDDSKRTKTNSRR